MTLAPATAHRAGGALQAVGVGRHTKRQSISLTNQQDMHISPFNIIPVAECCYVAHRFCGCLYSKRTNGVPPGPGDVAAPPRRQC